MTISNKSLNNFTKKVVLISMIYIFILSSQAWGWTEKSYVLIARDAIQLMPDNFQWLMENYEDQFYRGLKEPVKDYENASDLIKAIMNFSEASIKTIQKNHQYRDAARVFGVIARMAAKLNHPLGFNLELIESTWKTDYDIYLEKKRSKFRIRWYGQKNLPKSRKELSCLLSNSSAKNSKISSLLIQTLNQNQTPIERYDERSIPFGVGSIAYSNAVANTAYIWLHSWYHTGGVRVPTTR